MNKTITIYELLGLVKDGKAPEKIKYRNMIYHINYEYGDYESNITAYRYSDCEEHYYLFEDIDMLKCQNDTVEIIEDDDKLKKIDKLNNVGSSISLTEFEDKQHLNNHILKDKINKIIDHINKIEERLENEK